MTAETFDEFALAPDIAGGVIGLLGILLALDIDVRAHGGNGWDRCCVLDDHHVVDVTCPRLVCQQDQYGNYNNDLVLHKKGGSEGQARDGAG